MNEDGGNADVTSQVPAIPHAQFEGSRFTTIRARITKNLMSLRPQIESPREGSFLLYGCLIAV